jgi:uncharacterized protein
VNPHELSIPVHDLDAAGKKVHFRLRAPWVRTVMAEGPNEITIPADGELDVRISRSGTDVVVHGTLTADLQVPCARCLEPAAVHIAQPVSVLMVPGHKIKAALHGDDEEAELSEEEADVLAYDGDTVVLDDLVRDELLLAIPMIPLCSEDCPGISPPLAGEAAPSEPVVDPRLAPLLKFKKDRQE